MKIHIEGMGILGGLLAHKLWLRKIPFTWSDVQSPINAWQASTGCVYPSGDPVDTENYYMWQQGYFNPLDSIKEWATYCFLSVNPPHHGSYEFQRVGKFGVASIPSMHFNAQEFVAITRSKFHHQQAASPPKYSQVIVAHGFNERCERYLWGWTVLAQIKYPKLPKVTGSRHCLYMRKGRFELDYAYPVPNTRWWYTGSSLISQKVPKPLDIIGKFQRWQQRVGAHGVYTTKVGKFLQGWRPVPYKDDSERLIADRNHKWIMKPLWHSGIRHAPMMVEEVLKRL